MGTSRALLIAVPLGLEFVREDTAAIREALLSSGWADGDVTVLDTLEQTSRTQIFAALHDFFARCADDDFVLVYFSGHGVRLDGVDHLVPADATPAAAYQSLVPLLPDQLLATLTSRATVMLCVDACRDDAGADVLPPPTPPAPSRTRENVVLVHACAAGEQAMGTAAGSFLGRALAEALAADSPPRTVAEVIAHVRRRTREIADDNGCSRRHWVQDRWLAGPGESVAAEHAGREICRTGPGVQEWTRAMHGSELWHRIDTGQDVNTGRLKDALSALIDKVLAVRRAAGRPGKAGADPWENPRYPERVLTQLDRLVPVGEGTLSPLEAVTLLATPFVREAAVACGRRALAELYPPHGPLDPDTPPAGAQGIKDHLRQDMADVRKAYGQIDTRRRRLAASGCTDAAVAAEQWLRHRLLADWDQLWEQLTDPAGAGRPLGALDSLAQVAELLTDAAGRAAGLGSRPSPTSRERLRSAVLQVVTQMRGRPGDTAPDGRKWKTTLAQGLGIGGTKWWRPRQLAGLLHLAELLAVDPRLLDGIVVDHLGVEHHETRPADVVAQVAAGEFRPVDGPHRPTASRDTTPGGRTDWTLEADCGTAALHLALERQAEAAASTARSLWQALPEADLFARLPKHINTDALEPGQEEAYEAPPPRFQLAEDGVKSVIMGTQLYGDHTLAVRELYQNALDACRRRHARQQYAARTGEIRDTDVKQLADYTVRFVLDRDETDGRVYIECADDGIGMTAEELRDLFARAGRRYEQSPTRVRELRRWRRVGVEPELNSRFGIGVFSYFMLAESIRVTTRPTNANGRGTDGPGHRVDVVADSGLMHITRSDEERAGTSVRLYLRPEYSANPPSLIGILRENVWHSDVAVAVTDRLDGSWPDVLPPNTLRVPVAVSPTAVSPNVWWVPGEGACLVDGIFVRGAARPHGYVVNLRRRHRPVLSADRNRLEKFDRELAYRDLADAAGDLTQWDQVPLEWLWKLTEDRRLSDIVLDRLLACGAKVSITKWYDSSFVPRHDVPLRTVGCVPLDNSQTALDYHDDEHRGGGLKLFSEWRAQLVGLPQRQVRTESSIVGLPKGFPRPHFLDAQVFRVSSHLAYWDPAEAALRAAADGQDLRTVLRVLRRYAVAGIAVPQARDVRRLGEVPCGEPLMDLYEAYRHEPVSPGFMEEVAEGAVHAPLLRVAGRYHLTIGQVTELVRQLRIFDTSIPEPPDAGELASCTPGPKDVLLLGGDRATGRRPALPARVTPAVAAFLAARCDLSVSEIAAVARRYERYGYEVTGDFDTDPLSPAEEAVLRLPHTRSGVPQLIHQPFGLLRLVRLSAHRRDPDVGRTADSARAVTVRLGLGDVAPGPLASVEAPDWWASLGSEDLPEGERLGVWAVLRALARHPEPASVEDEVEAVAALAAAGVVDARAADAVRTWWSTPWEERPALLPQTNWAMQSQTGGLWSFSAAPPDTADVVDGAFLLALAIDQRSTLGAVADAVRAEAEPYGIDVVEVPEEARGLRPDLTEFEALCDRMKIRWRAEITHRQIIRYAEQRGGDLPTATARLRLYQGIGAPEVPRKPAGTSTDGPRAQRRLPSPPDDPACRRLLTYEPLSDGILTPLALTVTAVRLERTLHATYQALAPYADYGLELACPGPPDDEHEPDWRDVVLLSEHLTGAEPGLKGEVTDDHIQLAAEETELTVDEVRRRLVHYAPLFGLHLAAQERNAHARS
ncbi:GTP-binding protein [Streptomyces sp. Ru71]|uniref:HD domain-containing protein n=1 Tax=Streptomyces sp. Ru71 TaxID=2080746 RepID=UPI000CDE1E7B|nr:caspase family protein [Streptomyces sp. Ru71]POX56487.1 GTP-binding protein [Streptomyces sp. Ru71]